jgi:hypothetical protein
MVPGGTVQHKKKPLRPKDAAAESSKSDSFYQRYATPRRPCSGSTFR